MRHSSRGGAGRGLDERPQTGWRRHPRGRGSADAVELPGLPQLLSGWFASNFTASLEEHVSHSAYGSEQPRSGLSRFALLLAKPQALQNPVPTPVATAPLLVIIRNANWAALLTEGSELAHDHGLSTGSLR
jgi:hypothetical protein